VGEHFLLVGLIVCYSIWMMKLSAEGELAQTPASDDEKRQWERSQARASLVLSRITVRELLGLVYTPANTRPDYISLAIRTRGSPESCLDAGMKSVAPVCDGH